VAEGFHYNNDPNEPIEVCKLARGSYYYIAWALHEPSILDPGVSVPQDLGIVMDPANQGAIITLAYSLIDDDLVNAFVMWYGDGLSPEEKEEDLGPAPRLRMGIERFFITDINNPAASSTAASEIPVMWDEIAVYGGANTFNHVPGGGNCLYMDGHVEWLPWPSEFPADTIGILISACFS